MPTIVQELIERWGRAKSVAIVLVGVGSLIAIWGFAHWATAPTWVTVQPGLTLEGVAEVTAALDEAGVSYRLGRGGTDIRVPDAEAPRARVLLAQQGLLSSARPGFELFDQPAWGMTDFTQRINYRRALEGELERTIGQMRGVEAAQVHLAIPDGSRFRRSAERAAEASVVVKLRSGARPPREFVEGITFLVASSVEGLSDANVTVLDDGGRVLNSPASDGNPSVRTKRQLDFQREVESYLERKAENLVAQIVGPENVEVRVAAAINFDQVQRTVRAVDPNAQAIVQEQRSEIIPGPTVEGAGSTVENTTYEVTRSMEQFSSGAGSLERLTVAVLVNDRVEDGATGTTVPRTPAELRQVEALVRNAVGIDETRGDAISVVSVPFDPTLPLALPAPGGEGPNLLSLVRVLQRPVIGLLAVVLAFVIALRVIKSLSAARGPASGAGELPAGAAAGAVGRGDGEAVRLPQAARAAEPRTEGAEQVHATISVRPENAVRVVRAWMKD